MVMRLAGLGVVTVLAAVLGAATGCSSSSSGSGSGGDCTSLCTAAQAGKCTSIKGDCAKFCAAIGAVDGPANCSSQYSAYESCLGTPASVCANSCNAKESALTNCVTPYCAAHSSDANCATLIGSF